MHMFDPKPVNKGFLAWSLFLIFLIKWWLQMYNRVYSFGKVKQMKKTIVINVINSNKLS